MLHCFSEIIELKKLLWLWKNEGSITEVSACVFEGNNVSTDGGAIFISVCTLELISCQGKMSKIQFKPMSIVLQQDLYINKCHANILFCLSDLGGSLNSNQENGVLTRVLSNNIELHH